MKNWGRGRRGLGISWKEYHTENQKSKITSMIITVIPLSRRAYEYTLYPCRARTHTHHIVHVPLLGCECRSDRHLACLEGIPGEGLISRVSVMKNGMVQDVYGGTAPKFCMFHKRGLLPLLPVEHTKLRSWTV